jgi:hypothetical protein
MVKHIKMPKMKLRTKKLIAYTRHKGGENLTRIAETFKRSEGVIGKWVKEIQKEKDEKALIEKETPVEATTTFVPRGDYHLEVWDNTSTTFFPTITTGGLKYDEGKVRMDLLPPHALESIAKVFTFGAQKYASYNWAKGIPFSKLRASLQRHLTEFDKCEDVDPESGLHHLWHAGCNIIMLIEMLILHPELDDRPDLYGKRKIQDNTSIHS